jgi:calcineurin-like phosphoesterase family protein
MKKIFVTSDTFFGRVEILDIAVRPFEDITDMNEAIIKNWNEVVKDNDIVYHLGNFAWTPLDAEECLTRLNGQIKLILGDYDNAMLEISKFMKDKLEIIPVAFYKEPKTSTVLSHWPMLQWPGKNKGLYHFHGHSLREYPTDLQTSNRVNACIDNWHYVPKEINDMLDLFKEFKVK